MAGAVSRKLKAEGRVDGEGEGTTPHLLVVGHKEQQLRGKRKMYYDNQWQTLVSKLCFK